MRCARKPRGSFAVWVVPLSELFHMFILGEVKSRRTRRTFITHCIPSVESGVYYKRHSLRGYVLNMFTTYGCAMSRYGCSTSQLQYCTACLRLTDLAIV